MFTRVTEPPSETPEQTRNLPRVSISVPGEKGKARKRELQGGPWGGECVRPSPPPHSDTTQATEHL